jgi:cytochrome bd-type quinol oxidase subunit 2
MNLGKGTCANSKNVCCLDDGSGNSGTTTPGAGITFPPNTGLPTNEKLVKGIFENVANFLLSIIGIIAIISFVISGIQYFLVATDEKMMETAKKTMVASIIGLVVALFGYIAVKTVEMLLKS